MVTTARTIDRRVLTERLMLNHGGESWGITPIGMMLAAQAVRREIKSIVAVAVDTPPRCSNEELQLLVKISEGVTSYYRRILGPILYGDNLRCVRKYPDGRWTMRCLSWECGPVAFERLQSLYDWFVEKGDFDCGV